MFKKYALAAVITACTFVSYSQNVGIGVEHPGSRLSVKGGISIGETYAEKPAPDGVILIEKSMGIGTDTIDPNVVLDIRSATKGVLFPTMSTSTIQSLVNPPKGLMVFNNDSAGFNFYNGTSWINFALLGPSGPIGAAANLLGGLTGGGSGAAYGATSNTVLPVTIGTGTKVFTVPVNMSYRANDRVRISNSSSKYMEGVVTSYIAGVLTVNVDRIVGSGSYTSWTIGITGDVGATGPQGLQGLQGIQGVAGAQGIQGLKGATGATGATGPAGAQGIQGLKGATGATGADGQDGTASRWLSGNGNVGNGQGNVGDWYLRTSNGDLYEKTGSLTWTHRMNIMGSGGSSSGWSLSGNAASNGNFIGTTNTQPLLLKVNNNTAGYIAYSDKNTFLGYQTGYTGTNNVGIGASTYVTGSNSIAVGYQAQSQTSNGIAIGRASYVSQQYGVAMGDNAQAQANAGLALGKSAYVSSADGVAIGTSAQAQGVSGLAIGKGAYVSASNGIVLGTSAQVQGTSGIGIGKSVYVSGASAIGIGENASAQGAGSIVIGNNIYNGNANTTAIGASTNTSVNFSGATSTSYALMVGTNNTNGNGAYLTKGGTWTNASDRNLKEDVTALNAYEVLNKVAGLNISKWKYIGTDEYHIGPMAQDFYAAFNLGGDDKRVSTIDPSGVALVAIQALNNKVEEQQKLINELTQMLNKRSAK
jgi:hypothetical protein